ncbi:hypothetical protein MTO96_000506 [Rhipicephalus appendiculatus]
MGAKSFLIEDILRGDAPPRQQAPPESGIAVPLTKAPGLRAHIVLECPQSGQAGPKLTTFRTCAEQISKAKTARVHSLAVQLYHQVHLLPVQALSASEVQMNKMLWRDYFSCKLVRQLQSHNVEWKTARKM